MVINWKRASVGTSLVLAASALVGYAYTRATAPPTYHLANGVDVTVTEVPLDDTEQSLDMKIWKLDVTIPDTNDAYSYTVDECQYGKVVKSMGDIGFKPARDSNHHFHVTLGIIPLDHPLLQARQLKFSLSEGFGSQCDTLINPFRGGGYDANAKPFEAENRIDLIRANQGNPIYVDLSKNATSLALTIRRQGTRPQ